MQIEEYTKVFKEYPAPIGKELWVQDYFSMITHTRGDLRTDLLTKRRPFEDDTNYAYRIANIRYITREIFIKAMRKVQRIASNSQVEVIYPEEIRELCEGNNFDDQTLVGKLKHDGIPAAIEMANGLFVVWPENVGDSREKLSYKILFVNPENIVHFDKDVCTFLSDEKSPVEYYGRIQNEGDVYYTILPEGLFKRVQVGKKTEKEFEWVEYYGNPTGVNYAMVLPGDRASKEIEKKDRTKVTVNFHTSFFSVAVPQADEALSECSDHTISYTRTAHPIPEVESIECPTCEGRGSLTVDNKKTQCHICRGEKSIGVTPGPFGTIKRPLQTNALGGRQDTSNQKDAITWLHPPVDILKYQSESYRQCLSDAEKALNLLHIAEAQSGTAKDIDRTEDRAAIDVMADAFFNYMLRNIVQVIYMFDVPGAVDYPEVPIKLPMSFVEVTVQDIIDEIKVLKEQNAPQSILSAKYYELMYKMTGGDPTRMKIYEVINYIDPFALFDKDEKQQLRAVDTISEYDMKVSTYAPSIVERYAMDTINFIDEDFFTTVQKLQQIISQRIGESQV